MLAFRWGDWRDWRWKVCWSINGYVVDHGRLSWSRLRHVNHEACRAVVLLDVPILIRKLRVLSMHGHIHVRILLLIDIFAILVQEVEVPPTTIGMGYIFGMMPVLVRDLGSHGMLTPCGGRYLTADHLGRIVARFGLHNWNDRRVRGRLKSIVTKETH